MIINAANQEIFKGKPGDEIVTADAEEYYMGTPHYTEVTDIVRDNGKIVILTR